MGAAGEPAPPGATSNGYPAQPQPAYHPPPAPASSQGSPGAFSGPPPGAYPPPASPGAYQPPPAAAPSGAPPGAPVVMLHAAPIPGVRIRVPKAPPQPGQVLLGYELYKPRVGPCMCDGLSMAGLISVIILILVFPFVAWIPCVIPSCFEQQQRPVYGWPADTPQPPPGAAPTGMPPATSFNGATAAGYPASPGLQA